MPTQLSGRTQQAWAPRACWEASHVTLALLPFRGQGARQQHSQVWAGPSAVHVWHRWVRRSSPAAWWREERGGAARAGVPRPGPGCWWRSALLPHRLPGRACCCQGLRRNPGYGGLFPCLSPTSPSIGSRWASCLPGGQDRSPPDLGLPHPGVSVADLESGPFLQVDPTLRGRCPASCASCPRERS